MHDIEYISPIEYTPPLPPELGAVASRLLAVALCGIHVERQAALAILGMGRVATGISSEKVHAYCPYRTEFVLGSRHAARKKRGASGTGLRSLGRAPCALCGLGLGPMVSGNRWVGS